MLEWFHSNNWKQRWSRFISCAVLGLYLSALVAVPALHWHLFDHSVAVASEQSDSAPVPHDDNACPFCEFLRVTVPFFVDVKPVLSQTDVVAEISLIVSEPLVAYATVLPPSRAPPVV